MPKAIDVISNVKQIEAPGSRELISGQGHHVGVLRTAGGLTDRLKKAVAPLDPVWQEEEWYQQAKSFHKHKRIRL